MKERRKHERSHSAQDAIMEVFGKSLKGKDSNVVGLLLNESWHGCCAVFKKPFPLKRNYEFKANVSNLHELKADIKWIVDVDDSLVKIGFSLW
ncbi:MAG: hypothetical protein KKH98_05505 [Spirochaetes bacterium]|nr:hypothetical protein [Spirochaetota bacterium]